MFGGLTPPERRLLADLAAARVGSPIFAFSSLLGDPRRSHVAGTVACTRLRVVGGAPQPSCQRFGPRRDGPPPPRGVLFRGHGMALSQEPGSKLESRRAYKAIPVQVLPLRSTFENSKAKSPVCCAARTIIALARRSAEPGSCARYRLGSIASNSRIVGVP